MENLDLYEKVRAVPQEAQKPIKGGRLSGMTDINPMWRIKKLTEQFGPCGIGWYPEIVDRRIENGSGDQKVAIIDIQLFVKIDGGWSKPIPGTGGSMLVANEKSGPFTSDEAFKMAYTDALSVCCKLLGMGADIYWQSDRDKYTGMPEETRPQKPAIPPVCSCSSCGKEIISIKNGGKLYTAADIAKNTKNTYGKPLCWACARKEEASRAAGSNPA